MTSQIQPKRECGANVRTSRKPLHSMTLSGPTVARIVAEVDRVLAENHDEEISAIVARRTGYCEKTVDYVMAMDARASRAANATLISSIRGGIDESTRTYWSVATETAA